MDINQIIHYLLMPIKNDDLNYKILSKDEALKLYFYIRSLESKVKEEKI